MRWIVFDNSVGGQVVRLDNIVGDIALYALRMVDVWLGVSWVAHWSTNLNKYYKGLIVHDFKSYRYVWCDKIYWQIRTINKPKPPKRINDSIYDFS